MKKNIYYTLLIVLSVFQACSKEQTMVNKMDGEWEIEQISFIKNGEDSIVTAPIGVFYFEKCELGTGTCPGYYEVLNHDRVVIGYSMNARTDKLNISLLSEADLEFVGPYDLETFSKKKISVTGKLFLDEGMHDIKMDLSKK